MVKVKHDKKHQKQNPQHNWHELGKLIDYGSFSTMRLNYAFKKL